MELLYMSFDDLAESRACFVIDTWEQKRLVGKKIFDFLDSVGEFREAKTYPEKSQQVFHFPAYSMKGIEYLGEEGKAIDDLIELRRLQKLWDEYNQFLRFPEKLLTCERIHRDYGIYTKIDEWVDLSEKENH